MFYFYPEELNLMYVNLKDRSWFRNLEKQEKNTCFTVFCK